LCLALTIWRKPEDAAKTLDELSSRDEELYRFEKMLEGERGLIYLLDGLGGLLGEVPQRLSRMVLAMCCLNSDSSMAGL
jgi:hypothetical protein